MISGDYIESFRMALYSLTAHKMRSILTLLGIMVGVFSIIVVMTAIRILQGSIEGELSSLGSNTFRVQRLPTIQVQGSIADWQRIQRRRDLTYKLGEEMKERISDKAVIGFETNFGTREAFSQFEQTNPDVQLIGVSPESFAAKSWEMEQGRPLVANDIDSARRVCVLGFELSESLFPLGNALDETVKFDGIKYRVVGILESKGGSLGGNQGNFMAIPITTGLQHYGARRSIEYLIQARSQEMLEDVTEEVRGILRALRKVPPGEEDDFEISSNDSLISQFRSITFTIRMGAGIVSSIALMVAGIGIMNIMLVSVTERTREIGIRRAIGAKKKNILVQFILEAIVLCQAGGVIGIAFGVLAGNYMAVLLNLPPSIPLDWTLIGLGICSFVGIAFGTYPAYKAANLDPIEALRYE